MLLYNILAQFLAQSFSPIFFKVTPLEENDTMLLYGDMGNYSIGGFQFKFKARNIIAKI